VFRLVGEVICGLIMQASYRDITFMLLDDKFLDS
jgi:hypothetical protein